MESKSTTLPKMDDGKPGIELVDTDNMSEGTTTLATLAEEQTAYEKSLSFKATLQIFWRVILYITYGQLVVFGFGIDGIIAGYLLAIPKFREDYGKPYIVQGVQAYIIPATWQSLYGGTSQLAAIIGAFATGYLADAVGRRRTNIIACAVSMAGVGAQYASTTNGSLGILTVGKTINGFSIGMFLVIGPLYASEVAPLKLRGWLVAFTNMVQFCGVLTFTGIMYKLGPMNTAAAYKIPLACQWIVPGIVLCTIWLWPESPVWLVRQKRVDDAKKALETLHGNGGTIRTDRILAQIEVTLEHEVEQRGNEKQVTYMDCFKGINRKRTLICMFMYACQYFGGLVFVLGYQSYYYQLIGFSAEKSFLIGMINNVSMFVANICSWFLLSTVGRRPLAVWGQLACALSLLIIGGTSLPGTRPAYIATVAFMFVWGFVYQLTLGTVAYTVVGEVPSLEMRSRTQGLSNIVLNFFSWLVGFVFPYMFNPDQGNLSGKVGFIFGSTTLIGFIGAYLWLPETMNRTPAELDELYSRGINPRHFAKTTANGSGGVSELHTDDKGPSDQEWT